MRLFSIWTKLFRTNATSQDAIMKRAGSQACLEIYRRDESAIKLLAGRAHLNGRNPDSVAILIADCRDRRGLELATMIWPDEKQAPLDGSNEAVFVRALVFKQGISEMLEKADPVISSQLRTPGGLTVMIVAAGTIILCEPPK